MNSIQLSILPENKTLVFYSPIEGPDVLVRTGTSSFLNAVAQGCSKEYNQVDNKGKIKFIEKLSKTFYKNQWKDLEGVHISFRQEVSNVLAEFYEYTCNNEKRMGLRSVGLITLVENMPKKTLDTYKIICEIINIQHFEKDILPISYKNCSEKTLRKCKDEIVQRTVKLAEKLFDSIHGVDKQRRKYCVDKIEGLISDLLEIAESVACDKYTCKLDLTSEIIDLISDKFNYNIYFLESKNRMPYKAGNTIKNKRKSIILMAMGITTDNNTKPFSDNYEIVGKLLSDNKIQREFYFDEPLISCIHTFLYTPELVSEKYPTLTKYQTKGESSSESSDCSSDEEESSFSASASASASESEETFTRRKYKK
jgi:hypothetical protein